MLDVIKDFKGYFYGNILENLKKFEVSSGKTQTFQKSWPRRGVKLLFFLARIRARVGSIVKNLARAKQKGRPGPGSVIRGLSSDLVALSFLMFSYSSHIDFQKLLEKGDCLEISKVYCCSLKLSSEFR